MNNQTNTFTVIGARYRRTSDGKITAFLQVQSRPGSPVGYVRYNTSVPPLPGTVIEASGSVVNTKQGPVMQVEDSNITFKSGQQSVVLHSILSNILNRFSISFDNSKLVSECNNYSLCSINASKLIDILSLSDVQDASSVVSERETTFSSILSKNFISSFSGITLPFEMDSKIEIPFSKDSWPDDIMKGTLPDYFDLTSGLKGHSAMPNGKPFYMADSLSYDGIDNFFRALSIYAHDDSVFSEWMKSVQRPSALTKSYINDKQDQGTQIFTKDDLHQLEKLGLNSPAKIAARLGNMVQIPGANGINLIPYGTYQSSSFLSKLGKLSKHKVKLDVQIDDSGLDSYQKKALETFCEGAALTLISGPPGTGKSTLIARMISHAQQCKEKVVVVTPTGKASSRLNSSFEKLTFPKSAPTSTTIHSLFYGSTKSRKINKGLPSLNTSVLKDALDSDANDFYPLNPEKIMRFSSYKDGKNEVSKTEQSLYQDMITPDMLKDAIVFVDESTQVTSDLAALILEMNPKKLVMTGDLSQLKPVGAGKPFHDFISLAQDDQFKDQINFVELQIDHRATKELSDFTKKLRTGVIPLDYVGEYNDNPVETSLDLSKREAFVLECKTMESITPLVQQIILDEMSINNSVFKLDSSQQSNGSISLPYMYSDKTYATSIPSPSVMAMAYSNVEVSHLNHSISEILRPMVHGGQKYSEIASLSILAANDIKPGDTILQTQNSKQIGLYSTPQGNFKSSEFMNGETFLFIGANVWVPTLLDNNSDINNTLVSLWKSVGLLDDVVDLKINGYLNPGSHFDLYSKLQSVAHTGNKDALKLISMCFTEVLLIDPSILDNKSINTLEEKHIKRIALPPEPPHKDKLNESLKDEMLALLRQVWKFDIGNQYSKVGKTGLIDWIDYKSYYDKNTTALENFKLGYSFTVHKAQGSQSKIAISVVSPPAKEEESSNHEASVYTATTRAENSSYILIHGVKAAELNKIWSKNREIEKQKLSPVMLIARGQISPMSSLFTNITPYPPQRKNERINFEPTTTDLNDFTQKVMYSSLGYPGTTDIKSVNSHLQNKISGGKGITLIPGIHSYANSQVLDRNGSSFTWNRTSGPGVKQKELDIDMLQATSVFDFN